MMNEEYTPGTNPQQPYDYQQQKYQPYNQQQAYYQQLTLQQQQREEMQKARLERSRNSKAKPLLGLIFGIVSLLFFAYGMMVVMMIDHNNEMIRNGEYYNRAVGSNIYNVFVLFFDVPFTGMLGAASLVFSILSTTGKNRNKGLTTAALVLSIAACVAFFFMIFYLQFKFQYV